MVPWSEVVIKCLMLVERFIAVVISPGFAWQMVRPLAASTRVMRLSVLEVIITEAVGSIRTLI